jgi:hypothetical protein
MLYRRPQCYCSQFSSLTMCQWNLFFLLNCCEFSYLSLLCVHHVFSFRFCVQKSASELDVSMVYFMMDLRQGCTLNTVLPRYMFTEKLVLLDTVESEDMLRRWAIIFIITIIIIIIVVVVVVVLEGVVIIAGLLTFLLAVMCVCVCVCVCVRVCVCTLV